MYIYGKSTEFLFNSASPDVRQNESKFSYYFADKWSVMKDLTSRMKVNGHGGHKPQMAVQA